ncbi:MAG: hypothetical protein Q4E74_04910 [Ruminococcus sp.]|nr:hypothetical protein [Ruminococcus sp.]
MLFSKPEYREIFLPFRLVEDYEGSFISIEAYGEIMGEMKYCCITYGIRTKYLRMYDNGDYDQMVDKLKNSDGTLVKVKLIIKKKKVDFKIEPSSLAEAMNDDRFNALECLGRDLNDKKFEEIEYGGQK